jgi:ribosome-associated protein
VRRGLVIPGSELREQASRAGGPGGQHVNKANTRVTLRWSIASSSVLSDAQRARIALRLATRLTRGGERVIHAADERSRARNRALARERLAALVRSALAQRRPRRPTRPSAGSRERRLGAKQRRGELKRGRRPAPRDDG